MSKTSKFAMDQNEMQLKIFPWLVIINQQSFAESSTIF